MPIPPFDPMISALPPFLGQPTSLVNCSPFPCTILELCQRFSTSQARVDILQGFLDLRAVLNAAGVTGFQWIDGSFLENIEFLQNRDPRDVDVITFAEFGTGVTEAAFYAAHPKLADRPQLKLTYHVDHFLVPLITPPDLLVDLSRFWYGLFSHRRITREWKGMLRVSLTDMSEDADAKKLLGGKP